MVSKSLRMNAGGSPDVPAKSREFKRMKSLTGLADPVTKKYIHVHHFKNTKLFGAWFNDPSKPGKKVRLFFGSHLTAYLAARAQDRAALKYKPHALDPRSIKLNFKEEDYNADRKLREMLTCEEFGELLRKESRPKYTKMEPTPCLLQFLARERARGNIPSAVPAEEENIISLRQYLKEVIQKREQPAEQPDESNAGPESSDEEMEDPVLIAEQKKHASKMERKIRRKENHRKEKCIALAGSLKCKPRTTPVTAPAPLVWGQTRPRSERYEDKTYKCNKLKYKLHKIDSTDKKSRESAPPSKPEGLALVEGTINPERGNEGGVPQSPELQFRIKWQYKMQKLRNASDAETLPAKDIEETKTPEPSPVVTEGLPQAPEFPNLQFRSKWHYMLHKVPQWRTTSGTGETCPKNAEGSYLEALAITVVSQAGKLV